MAKQTVAPLQYFLPSTPHVPNSKLPVLVYRAALPADLTDEETCQIFWTNGWFKGGQWNGSPETHFHSNTHECYAVVRGSTTYTLGRAPKDPGVDGKGQQLGFTLHVMKGDVFILPAGVSHASKDSKDGYEFIGFYPRGSPKWDMNYCEAPSETQRLGAACENVSIPPSDPLYGLQGPLPQIWAAGAGGET